MSDRKISVTLDIGADIAKVRAAANELSQILNKSNFNSSFSGKIEGMVSKLNGALSELEVKSSKAMSGLGDTKSVETSINKVNTVIKNITAELNRMGTAGSDSLLKLIDGMDEKWSKAGKAQREYTKALKDTDVEAKRLARDLENAQSKSREANRKVNSEDAGIKSIEESIKQLKAQKEALKSSGGLSYESIIGNLETAKEDLKKIETIMSNIAGKEKFKLFKAGDTSSFSEDQLKQLTEYGKLLDETTTKIKNLENQQSELNDKRKEFDAQIRKAESDRNSAQTRQGTAQREYEAQEHAIEELQEKIKNLNASAKDTAAFENYKQKLKDIFGDESLLKAKNIDELNTALEELKKNGATLASDQLQKLLQIANSSGAPLQRMGESARKAGDGLREMTDRASEIDMLTHRLKYFFSLAGGFNLLRRAVRSAVTTTKELDAVMTQTAVVSSYSISDMWKMLPQYSAEAKKLGVAIKDVYSAQTLYVQQGLDMNSAMKIGTETLKMSRVANISASEATNSMTAALRGFNMELTERSAKRVNDVYSKLAQNTASNTQEISTAMTKTAALANSANMSFENTAAFLATIIESTREGAETAGTALKTVIARFTEVKKLYSQGELLGTDEEGQEVNVNKISAALRTAGINMNEFFTGAKGLDEIFMELGSKWDSLTTVQQRYIATMAAGSRQQSRFLALMQNYSRTVELTNMAYNSAGSGQEQFDKTLESLDAKINRFKDAWDTFIMSLANSDAIKGIVDFGTNILDFLNNIIDKISGGNGLIKSILSIGTAIGVFKGARAIFKSFMGDFRALITGTSRTNTGGIIGNFASIWGKTKQRAFNTREGFRGIPELFGFRYFKDTKIDAKTIEASVKNAQQDYDARVKELEDLKKQTPEQWAARTGWKVADKRVKKPETVAKYRQAAYNNAIEKKQEEVGKKEEQLNNANEEGAELADRATASMTSYAASMQAVSVAAGVAAGALGLLANHLKETGNEDAAKVIETIASGLGILSAVAGVAGVAFNAFAVAVKVGAAEASTAIAAIPIIGWIAAIITILGTATVAFIKYGNSAKKNLADAKKALTDQEAYLASIKDKYSEIKEAINSLKSQEETISTMTQGTLEWSDAVDSLNNNIREFAEKYPDFIKAVQFDQTTGHLTLNDDMVESILKDYDKNIILAQQEKDAKTISVAKAQFTKDVENLSPNFSSFGFKLSEDESLAKAKLLSENLESYDVNKYTSTMIQNLIDHFSGYKKDAYTKEEKELIKEIVQSNFWSDNGVTVGNWLKNGVNDINSSAFTDKTLQDFLYKAKDYYSFIEAYRNYAPVVGKIAKTNAISYAAEKSQYNGIVNKTAAQKGVEAYQKVIEQEIDKVTSEEISDWAKSKGYKATSQSGVYVDDNGKQYNILNSKIDKEIKEFAKVQRADAASKKAEDTFLAKIATANYALISGKGTANDYAVAEKNATDEDLKALYTEYWKSFIESREKLGAITGTKDSGLFGGVYSSFADLNLSQTQNLADLAETWQQKFGVGQTKNLLSSFDKFLNTNPGKTAIDGLITVIQDIESGAIDNLEDFRESLAIYGIDLENLGIDTSILFKKPKNFAQAQEELKANLEFWNTARSSTAFSKEDRNKLIQGGMKKEDFILTSEGYISTKNTTTTGQSAKENLIKETTNEINARKAQIEALTEFNKRFETGDVESVLNSKNTAVPINKILNSEDLSKEDATAVWNILNRLTGGQVYNQNTGETISIDQIAEKDAASFLQYYLDNIGNIPELIKEQGSLELELEEIENSKLLDLAPAIQSAIVDLITKATEKGINVSDKDIDTFIGGRAQFGNERKYNEFLGGLEQLDWDEIDDIDDFTEKLKELGIEFYNTGEDAQDLFNRLQQIYASDSSVTEKADKEIKKLTSGKSAAEKIANGETILSDSEFKDLRNVLKETGSFKEQDWVRTGLDEWTYIGNDTNSLLSSIDGAVQAIAGKIINEAKEGVEKGQKIQGIIDSTKWPKSNGDKRPWGHAAGEIFAESTLKTFNDSALQDLAKYLDIGTQDEEGNSLERESLIPLILDYYNKYYGENGEAYAANIERYNAMQGSAILPYLYENPQSLLNAAVAGTDNGALYAQVVNNDLVPRVNQFRENIEQNQGNTIVSEDPEKAAEETRQYEASLQALAVAANKTEKDIDNLNSSLSENFQTLKDAPKGTTAYTKALNKILQAAKKVFGDDTDEKFIEEHIEDFEALAKGGDAAEEAFSRLAKIKSDKLLEGIGSALELTDEQLALVQSHWNELDGSQLEVGGSADLGGIISEMQLTESQAQALSDYLNSIPGLSATWVPGPDIEEPGGSVIHTGHLEITRTGASGSGFSGGGGGGGGGKKEFKNDFDKYYNQVEDINELERQRNLLESDYQQLLKSRVKSGKQIYDNLKKQIELLEEQRFLVDDLAEKRKQQIFDTMKDEQYKDVAKYAWWNEEDQTIEIDWQSIDKIKDSETGDLVKEYVGKLEDFQSKYDEQIEALEDIEDTLQEIAERGKEEYTSLEDRARDALIQKIQDQIEDLTKVNEAINEANQKVLDSISETLELQRQERENAKAEESLADKEQRLAYLRQDSSNANAVEIARLEKELEEERENYTDTLIDQKISELQKQNEKAQEQRQQQIDLMQESLDYQEKTGAFWDQVYQYINQGIDALGQLVQGSALQDLLMGGEGITGLSQIGQMEWLKELEGQVAQAVGYLYLSRQLEKVGTKEGTTITFTNAEGQELTGVVDSKGNVTVTKEDGSKVVYKNVYQDYAGKYKTLESEADAVAPEEPATTTKPGGTERPPVYQGNGTGKDWSIKKVGSAWSVYSNVNHGEYATEAEARSAAYEKNKAESIWGVKLIQSRYSPNMLGGNYTFYEAQQAANSLNAGKPIVTPYATGGLNTHTGPAWLDGTKSHPELVLNARDTENFIQLKDTLATLKANGGLNLAGGDNYYDIVVNVDQMSSDYDVDRAIDRIKARLYQDGAYRNVNTLSRLR